MVALLNASLRTEAQLYWSTDCQAAFQAVKTALTSAPVLRLPDESKFHQNGCDASGQGVGPVLMQEDRPIAFESRCMNATECNYGPGEQELLAVVHVMRLWQCYVEGIKSPFAVLKAYMSGSGRAQATLTAGQAQISLARTQPKRMSPTPINSTWTAIQNTSRSHSSCITATMCSCRDLCSICLSSPLLVSARGR